MFDFLGMAYTQILITLSLITLILITLLCIILVLKCTLLVKLWVLLSYCRPPLLEHLLQISSIDRLCLSVRFGSTAFREGPWRFWLHCHDWLIYNNQSGEKYLNIHPNALTLTCRNSPCCEQFFFALLLAAIAHSTRTAWLSRDMCVTWKEL